MADLLVVPPSCNTIDLFTGQLEPARENLRFYNKSPPVLNDVNVRQSRRIKGPHRSYIVFKNLSWVKRWCVFIQRSPAPDPLVPFKIVLNYNMILKFCTKIHPSHYCFKLLNYYKRNPLHCQRIPRALLKLRTRYISWEREIIF